MQGSLRGSDTGAFPHQEDLEDLYEDESETKLKKEELGFEVRT